MGLGIFILFNILALYLNIEGAKKSFSLSPDLGISRMLEVPDWALVSLSCFGYGHWTLFHPYFK